MEAQPVKLRARTTWRCADGAIRHIVGHARTKQPEAPEDKIWWSAEGDWYRTDGRAISFNAIAWEVPTWRDLAVEDTTKAAADWWKGFGG